MPIRACEWCSAPIYPATTGRPHASATQPAARPHAAPPYSQPATPTPGNAAPSPKDGDHPTDPANTTDPTSTQLPDRESRLSGTVVVSRQPRRRPPSVSPRPLHQGSDSDETAPTTDRP